MKEDTIENINRDLLIKMINQYEFLGVFFCKFMVHLRIRFWSAILVAFSSSVGSPKALIMHNSFLGSPGKVAQWKAL